MEDTKRLMRCSWAWCQNRPLRIITIGILCALVCLIVIIESFVIHVPLAESQKRNIVSNIVPTQEEGLFYKVQDIGDCALYRSMDGKCHFAYCKTYTLNPPSPAMACR